MLYLYHGTTSVCAIKVRLTLAEKALPWEGEVLWLQRGDQYRPDYLKLNPNAVVPTLVHDGKVIIESTLIMEYLDEAFPDVPLMPRDPCDRAQVRLWLKRVDELHVHCGTITAGVAFRLYFMRQTPDGRDAYVARMLDPVKRQRLQRIMDDGLAAPDAMDAARRYDTFVGAMESALAQSDYLVGNSFTLADAAAIPYINRAGALGLAGLWENRRPRVADWYTRMRQRPSFNSAITAYLDDDARQRFDVPRDEVWAECTKILSLN
ncbi:MAG TPA: glutathione S-transferase family protein [Xanthobacteraceae bacterium]|nr:glutathione S-transferase family protein [Xanthobacteraceae bacterium]